MVIKLNIGGTLFVTSQATLMQFPTSVFGTIASGAWQPDYEGAFFFDRNPKYFEIILDAMRQKAMGQDCTLAPKYNTRAFRAELDFYQLSTLFGADEDEPVSPCSEDDPSTPSSKGSVISPSKTLPVLTLHYCIWSRSEAFVGRISRFNDYAFTLDSGLQVDLEMFFSMLQGQEKQMRLDHAAMLLMEAAKNEWPIGIEGVEGKVLDFKKHVTVFVMDEDCEYFERSCFEKACSTNICID